MSDEPDRTIGIGLPKPRQFSGTPIPFDLRLPHPFRQYDTTIGVLDRLAGKGKTNWVVKHMLEACSEDHDTRFLYHAPSKLLMNQVYRGLRKECLKYGITVADIFMKYAQEKDSRGRVIQGQSDPSASPAVVADVRKLLGMGPLSSAISDTVPEPPPRILVISTACFRLLGSSPALKSWNVIQDEVFDPTFVSQRELDKELRVLSDRFQASNIPNIRNYYYLNPRRTDAYYRQPGTVIQAAPADEVLRLIRDIAVASELGFELFVHKQSWDKTCRLNQEHWAKIAKVQAEMKKQGLEHIQLPNQRIGRLTIHGLLSPSFTTWFKSYTILSATFTETMLYRVWGQRFGVKWDSLNPPSIPPTKHFLNGRSMEIRYLNEHMLTKAKRDEWPKSHGNKQLINAAIEVVEGYFDLGNVKSIRLGDVEPDFKKVLRDPNTQATPYILSVNNDVILEGDRRDERAKSRGVAIPVISHGLNIWNQIDQAFFFTALNPDGITAAFLKDKDILGMDRADVLVARTFVTAYQALMRTSVRNDNQSADLPPVRWVVPDLDCAAWLATLFEGCGNTPDGMPFVGRLGDLSWDGPDARRGGRPPKNADKGRMSESEKQRRKRYKEMCIKLDIANIDPELTQMTKEELDYHFEVMPTEEMEMVKNILVRHRFLEYKLLKPGENVDYVTQTAMVKRIEKYLVGGERSAAVDRLLD